MILAPYNSISTSNKTTKGNYFYMHVCKKVLIETHIWLSGRLTRSLY